MVHAWSGYTGEPPGAARNARRGRVPPAVITLTHAPSGLSVSGRLPRGRFTRREMQDQALRLRRQLLQALERSVLKKA